MGDHDSSLVYPMFAMVVVTATVLVTLFRRHVHAVRERLITTAYYRIYQDQGVPEPESAAKAARHFSNLFEAPTLFYVACLAAMFTRHAGMAMVILAWCYVDARIAHAAIHLGPNRLRWRIRAYFASWLVLAAMWLVLVVGVASA
ncbi:MAG: MAPEG family protein [Gammaproteobacteria bacterium]|nr:MAPEG family protein [Gammaproteobacteria bacterium]